MYRDAAAEAGSADEVKVSKSGDGLSLLRSLVSNINSKQTAKRSFFSNLPFEIAPGLTISVNGYHILQKQQPARTCYVYLGGEKPQLAVSETIKMTDDLKAVEKQEVKKAYKFGGEYIHFTPEELAELKKLGTKTLRIIGFKPKSQLPIWASVKKSVFVFPTEEDVVGSTRVFSALWQKLIRDGKVGVAWFVPRVNAAPRLVAIIPSQSRDEDSSATPYLPAGLWLHPLPFADDVRSVDVKPSYRCSDELVDKMRTVVQNLQLPKAMYQPDKYPNPHLQWHYKILQTLALEEEVPETPEDLTVPKFRQIDKRVGGYLAEWKQDVAVAAQNLTGSREIKREMGADAEGEPLAKRPKISNPTGSTSNAQLKIAAEQDTLKKMTVAQLKDILTSKGVNPGGKKKAELVEALEQWLEDNA